MAKRRGSSGRGRSSGGRRDYQRTDRVGELLRQIIAEELAEIDDDSVAFVTVTEVDVDPELSRANVYLSTLDLVDADIEGVQSHAGRIRRAIGRQARLKRTPELIFRIDPGLRSGERVDQILRDLGPVDEQTIGAAEEE